MMDVLYVIVSPTVKAVEVVSFDTVTLGDETGNVTVLETTERVMIRPSGGVNVYVAVAILLIVCGLGNVSISTEKLTVLKVPGAIEPALIPVMGSAPA